MEKKEQFIGRPHIEFEGKEYELGMPRIENASEEDEKKTLDETVDRNRGLIYDAANELFHEMHLGGDKRTFEVGPEGLSIHAFSRIKVLKEKDPVLALAIAEAGILVAKNDQRKMEAIKENGQEINADDYEKARLREIKYRKLVETLESFSAWREKIFWLQDVRDWCKLQKKFIEKLRDETTSEGAKKHFESLSRSIVPVLERFYLNQEVTDDYSQLIDYLEIQIDTIRYELANALLDYAQSPARELENKMKLFEENLVSFERFLPLLEGERNERVALRR